MSLPKCRQIYKHVLCTCTDKMSFQGDRKKLQNRKYFVVKKAEEEENIQ